MTFLQSGQDQAGFENHYEDFQNEKSNKEFIFVAESPVMRVMHNKIKSLAVSPEPVLILGENGSGKATAAREIFNSNPANEDNRFMQFICHGLSQEIIEQNLFGDTEQPGLLNCGAKNTLFIKGLDCWTPALQDKFLSYISKHGQKKLLPRLICAVGDQFSSHVKDGHFSAELFKVLSQNLLLIPSLSERAEDIPSLIYLFNRQNEFQGRITQEALKVLKSHSWAGNITELKNVCMQISILYFEKELVSEEDLSRILGQKDQDTKGVIKYDPQLTLEDLINSYIEMSLNHFQSKRDSAKALGISIKTIYNKIKNGYVSFSD